MKLTDMQNPFVVARWQEILEHGITIDQVEPDETDPELLVFHLDAEDCDTWGIYSVLWVGQDGKIAEAMVNQPYYYATFSALVTAASARQAAS